MSVNAKALIVDSLEMSANLRWEKSIDGASFESFGQYGLGIGWQLPYAEVLTEISTYSSSSNESNLTIDESYYEWLNWFKYKALEVDNVSLYFGAGTGLAWQKITTEFLKQVEKSSSGAQWLLGLSSDVKIPLAKTGEFWRLPVL